jgi:DHA2 family multidrug resistance protein
MSYMDVPMRQNNDVSGLTNLARNVGGTCGTAFLVTMLARLSQRHQMDLATHVAAGDPIFMAHFNGLRSALVHAGVQSSLATQETYGRIYGQVQQQASLLAYIDIIKFFAVAALLMMPLVFLMGKRRGGGPAAAH